jgi:hypothetical protein
VHHNGWLRQKGWEVRNKFIAVVAGALVAIAIAGCGSSGSKESSSTTAPSRSGAGVTTTTAPSVTTTIAVSNTNQACALLSVAEINVAAGTSTGVTLGAQGDETQSLAQGDCIWSNTSDTNFVEVSTNKGTQALPEGVTDTLPGVGSDGYIATPTSASQLNAQCGAKTCDFTAVTNAAGYNVSVSAILTPSPTDTQTVAKALLSDIIAKLPS